MLHSVDSARRSNAFFRSALLPCALVAMACSSTVTGPPGAGEGPPGSSGSSGAAGSSGSSGASSGASGTGATGTGGGSTGGVTGTGGSSGVGGVGGDIEGYSIPLDGIPIHSHFVRITHQQWENAVRDLLRLPALTGLSSTFSPDPSNGHFSNNERSLFVTSVLRGDYERAVEQVANQVTGNAQSLAQVRGNASDAATFVRDFGRRAYRRPLDTTEQQRYEALFTSATTLFTSGDAFANGVNLVIRAMLQSPHFLYRVELGEDEAPLSGFEVASKLSFLIRDTIPDDALLAAAEGGELSSAEGAVARATTMLGDPNALQVFTRYHTELFGLHRWATIEKDRTRFPSYTDALKTELLEADRLFFEHLVREGKGFRDILLSPTAFVTAATAPLYGITSSGTGFQEVALGATRPGFFTRIGFLAYNANLRDPDPIHRGVDIMHRLLCSTLAPPPGEIPPLPEVMSGQTNRERVTAHTGSGTCAGCHSVVINPLGFAFENFDAIGQERTMDNGKPVDTADSYEFYDGLKPFANAPELLALLGDSPEAHACYSRMLSEFALARDVNETDRPLVNELTIASRTSQAPIRELLLSVVRSPRFLNRNGAM